MAPGARVERAHRGSEHLIKRVKRVVFGFRRFVPYRIRVLLSVGRPNWNVLATVTPS